MCNPRGRKKDDDEDKPLAEEEGNKRDEPDMLCGTGKEAEAEAGWAGWPARTVRWVVVPTRVSSSSMRWDACGTTPRSFSALSGEEVGFGVNGIKNGLNLDDEEEVFREGVAGDTWPVADEACRVSSALRFSAGSASGMEGDGSARYRTPSMCEFAMAFSSFSFPFFSLRCFLDGTFPCKRLSFPRTRARSSTCTTCRRRRRSLFTSSVTSVEVDGEEGRREGLGEEEAFSFTYAT